MKLGKYKITTRKQKQRLAIVIGAGVLILLVVSVNLLGDWLRDALNSRLQQ